MANEHVDVLRVKATEKLDEVIVYWHNVGDEAARVLLRKNH